MFYGQLISVCAFLNPNMASGPARRPGVQVSAEISSFLIENSIFWVSSPSHWSRPGLTAVHPWSWTASFESKAASFRFK